MRKLHDKEIDSDIFESWIANYNIKDKAKVKKWFNEMYQYCPSWCKDYNKGDYKKYLYAIKKYVKS